MTPWDSEINDQSTTAVGLITNDQCCSTFCTFAFAWRIDIETLH